MKRAYSQIDPDDHHRIARSRADGPIVANIVSSIHDNLEPQQHCEVLRLGWPTKVALLEIANQFLPFTPLRSGKAFTQFYDLILGVDPIKIARKSLTLVPVGPVTNRSPIALKALQESF